MANEWWNLPFALDPEDYFEDATMAVREAASTRRSQPRTPELALWIACLEMALLNARHLARGETLEKPSKDPRRVRWQLTEDVADLREWAISAEQGGRIWIASVVESCLGPDSFNWTRFDQDLSQLLSKADAIIETMAHQVIRDAISRPSPMQDCDVPRQDERETRVLPCPPRSGTKAVAEKQQRTIRERPRRKAMAQTQGQDPTKGRMAMSL